MKSKVKYAVLIIVIGLLGLAILASPILGKGKTTYLYDITITIDGVEFPTFRAAGNRNGTKIAGDGVYQQGMVDVDMSFLNLPGDVTGDDCRDEDPGSNTYPPGRPLYWSPLEDDYLGLSLVDCTRFSLTNHWQDLDSNGYNQWWKYHSGGVDYRKKTLSFRFDMFYYYYDEGERGAHDHYILSIEMEFEEMGGDTYYDGLATLNWTHYTEPLKPRGKNLQVEFQQFKCTCSREVTITITPLQ